MILESVLYSLGLILCAVLLAALTVEVTLRACKLFADTFLYEHISRKDFIDEEYHPYLSAWEDWSKPMFKYHSIGFRLFNTDISIGDKVQNNSLGFRCPEFTPPSDDEFRIVLIGGSAAWGSGASSNEATIAGQLEKCFNADRALLSLCPPPCDSGCSMMRTRPQNGRVRAPRLMLVRHCLPAQSWTWGKSMQKSLGL